MPDLSVSGIPGGVLAPVEDSYLRTFLYVSLQRLKTIRVLQVQCTEGLWLQKQLETFALNGRLEFYGLEENPEFAGALKKRLPKIPVFHEQFLKFGFPQNYFHFIYWDGTRKICGETLELLKKARHHLHPKGCFLIRYAIPRESSTWPLYQIQPDLLEWDDSQSMKLRDVWKLTQAAGFSRCVTDLKKAELQRVSLSRLGLEICSDQDGMPEELLLSLRKQFEAGLEGGEVFPDSSKTAAEIGMGEVYCLGDSYLEG